jgi:hypothetical protein
MSVKKGGKYDLIKAAFADAFVRHVDLKKVHIKQEFGLLFKDTDDHEAFGVLVNLLDIVLS